MIAYEIDVSKTKRCYVNSKITESCPVCDNETFYDFRSNYLSYPREGQTQEIYFYCPECDCEWICEIRVGRATLELEVLNND